MNFAKTFCFQGARGGWSGQERVLVHQELGERASVALQRALHVAGDLGGSHGRHGRHVQRHLLRGLEGGQAALRHDLWRHVSNLPSHCLNAPPPKTISLVSPHILC